MYLKKMSLVESSFLTSFYISILMNNNVPHVEDSSERSPQSSSRSQVQEIGMHRPLAQENWFGGQVRAVKKREGVNLRIRDITHTDREQKLVNVINNQIRTIKNVLQSGTCIEVKGWWGMYGWESKPRAYNSGYRPAPSNRSGGKIRAFKYGWLLLFLPSD